MSGNNGGLLEKEEVVGERPRWRLEWRERGGAKLVAVGESVREI